MAKIPLVDGTAHGLDGEESGLKWTVARKWTVLGQSGRVFDFRGPSTFIRNDRQVSSLRTVQFDCKRPSTLDLTHGELDDKIYLETMSVWRDEIETTVNSMIWNVSSIKSWFIMKILFKLGINIIENWFVAFTVVNGVTITGRVNNGQPKSNTTLFNLNCWRFNLNSLFNLN